MGIEQDLAAIERRRRLAEVMMQQGAEDIPMQTAGGMVVPVSPLQGISKIANMLSGAYIGNKADREGAAIKQARMDALGNIDFNSPDAASELAKAGMVEEAVKMRMEEAKLRAKAEGKGADPFFQFLPGEKGYLVGNARTGAVTQAMLDGQPVLKASDSPMLQSRLKAATEGQLAKEITDETGHPYYAPLHRLSPEFKDMTSPSQANNFNFGNLRPPGQSTGFQKFNSPQEGIAAIDRQLGLYGKRGIDTLQEIISTWAPPNENETGKLIQNAAKRTGLDPNQPLDLKDPNVLITLRNAIIRQEQRPSVAEGIIKGQSPAEAAAAKAQAELPIKIAEEQAKSSVKVGEVKQTESIKNEAELDKDRKKNEAERLRNAEKTGDTLTEGLRYLYPEGEGGQLDIKRDKNGRLIPPEKSMIYGASPADRIQSKVFEWTNSNDPKAANLRGVQRAGKQLALQALGGKLGTGVSNADVEFIQRSQGILESAQNINDVYNAYADIEQRVNSIKNKSKPKAIFKGFE